MFRNLKPKPYTLQSHSSCTSLIETLFRAFVSKYPMCISSRATLYCILSRSCVSIVTHFLVAFWSRLSLSWCRALLFWVLCHLLWCFHPSSIAFMSVMWWCLDLISTSLIYALKVGLSFSSRFHSCFYWILLHVLLFALNFSACIYGLK